MKNRSLYFAMAALIIFGLLLSACGPSATPEATKETAPTEEAAPTDEAAAGPKTYVLVPKNLGNPYFDTANNGAQEAAGELGVTVLYQGSATADAAEQITLLNSLIAQNVDGLAISANDADALVPTVKAAMDAGIPVVTWDSAIAPEGRILHINQAEAAGIAAVQIQMASELAGPDGGQIAILSATSTAPNQNAWIELMKTELEKPEYANLELVTTVYGDDQDEKSYNEALGLFTTYPDLKVIIAPTTVGIAASARAVQDQGLIGKVYVTGLGTPNQMREYVKSGASPQFALWNPGDLGYLAIYTIDALATGKITGKVGDTFSAGKLGDYTVQENADLGLNILLGLPFIYNADNIDDFDW
jgi:rhamnose transport system substrate-binding protein